MPPQSESMSLEESKKLMKCESDDQSTPHSVYLASEMLVRDDVSDLSGSYVSGINSGRTSVPGTVYQEASATGPWRQAYVASRLPPPKSNSCIIPPAVVRGRSSISARTTIDGCVEVIDKNNHKSDPPGLQKLNHDRIPVTVLLMDGNKHSYELLQVWINRETDSVRGVVKAVENGIPEIKWKTSYDGLFQVRGNRFTQLIHILKLSKYDIRQNEVLIAKPRTMSSKVAISHGSSAIRHLTNIQVITTDDEDRHRPRSSDGGPLLLSSAAQKRIYCPDGISSHHHATQFLTFSPPFDVKFQTLDMSMDDVQSTQGSNVSSIGMSSIQGQMVEELLASLRRTREQPVMKGQEPRDPLVPPVEGSETSTVSRTKYPQDMELVETSHGRRNVVGVMSQLNCFRTKQRVAALACCPPPEKDDFRVSSTSRRRNLTSVAEERSGSLEFHVSDVASPTLSGTEAQASMFYARRGNGRHVRLMEI